MTSIDQKSLQKMDPPLITTVSTLLFFTRQLDLVECISRTNPTVKYFRFIFGDAEQTEMEKFSSDFKIS